MKAENILLTVTEAATGPISALRFVNFAGARAVAADATVGVANANYDAGEQAGVNTHGLLLVEAGAAIAVGAQVQPDANGRAITLAGGVAAGRAFDAAAAAGDFIRILR